MPDPKPSNHWESLLSDLGATPPPDDRLKQPAPKESPSAKPAKSTSGRRPSPPQTANWDQVASELGLQPPPLPQPSPPPQKSATPSPQPRQQTQPPSPSPTEPELTRPTSVTPESGEESPNFFDERFDFEEPFDVFESPTKEKEEPNEPERSGRSEKRPRKRRRRRQPAKGNAGQSSMESAASEAEVGKREERIERDAKTTLSDGWGERASDEEDEPARTSSATEGDRQKKRRRPRRSKTKKRRQDQDDAERIERDIASEEPLERPGDEEDAELIGVASGGESSEQQRSERPVRAGFRGIPTWDETIGMIIDKNLENRSKRPNGGSQRGRGRKRRS